MGIAADFVLIVVAGLLGGVLARALRLPLLVGYIVAGVFIGPHTEGPTVAQIKDIETLAEIGVALLLFSVGIEISFRDLGAVRGVSLIGGPLQILVTMAAGAAAMVFGLQLPVSEGLWFGAMISVSSTMVVLKVLASTGHTTSAGKVMIGLLLVQDLAVIPMLIVLPQLGNTEGLALRLAESLALAGGILVVTFFAGTRLLPPLFRRVLSWGSRELFLVAVVATAVGIGAAMHAAGISFALGAFLAGLMLSESDFSHQALSDVVPLRDIFGLLFFVTVGMLFEPGGALQNLGLILATVTAIVTGKALIFGIIARVFGYRNMAPWVIGLGLSQIGEFSFVLARAGFSAELISKPVYDLALASTVITMALSPLLSSSALPLGRTWRRWTRTTDSPSPATAPDFALTEHVVVAGFGRTGRTIANALREAEIPFLVVELDYSLMADVRVNGFRGLWGDIAREEIQNAARVRQAKMMLLTMAEQNTVNLAVGHARRLNPGLILVARSTKVQYLHHLRNMGVAVAIQPEFESGLEMVRQGLLLYGRDEIGTGRIIDRLRSRMYETSE